MVLPLDGLTKEENEFLRLMIIDVYKRLGEIKNPRAQFAMMAHFELGYTQQEVAFMLGVSQGFVNRLVAASIEGLKKIYQKERVAKLSKNETKI